MRFHVPVVVLTVGLIGCDDCGEATPAIQGLCEPRIQVGTRADLEIVYQTDSSPMPLAATSASVADTSIATITLGPTDDRISITGIAVGQTTVELLLRDFDEPVWFALSIEPDAPMYQCDGRYPRGFDVTGRGQSPP
jgi:hypothetical protein